MWRTVAGLSFPLQNAVTVRRNGSVDDTAADTSNSCHVTWKLLLNHYAGILMFKIKSLFDRAH